MSDIANVKVMEVEEWARQGKGNREGNQNGNGRYSKDLCHGNHGKM
jgi:hypothetical protein